MARRRRKKKFVTTGRTIVVCLVIGGCWLWLYHMDQPVPVSGTPVAITKTEFVPPTVAPTKLLARTEPEESKTPNAANYPKNEEKITATTPMSASTTSDSQRAETVTTVPVSPPPAPPTTTTSIPASTPDDPSRVLIQKAQQALTAGDVLAARAHFATALAQDPQGPDADVLRDELSRIGEETILSQRFTPNDPLVDRYVIKDGDSLVKIAGQFLVSSDLLARVNGIVDKHRIRAGQSIKVVKGPFRAVVSKSKFRLDLYLQDVFVKSYPVGLGADGSTPTGEWRVGTKLINPTYYPPRGGDILSADDPTNPLGERWIGLIGISGEALGQERYGIHGTIEPESIGKNTSMGCIRLRNADVEVLYDFLVEKLGTVTVVD